MLQRQGTACCIAWSAAKPGNVSLDDGFGERHRFARQAVQPATQLPGESLGYISAAVCNLYSHECAARSGSRSGLEACMLSGMHALLRGSNALYAELSMIFWRSSDCPRHIPVHAIPLFHLCPGSCTAKIGYLAQHPHQFAEVWPAIRQPAMRLCAAMAPRLSSKNALQTSGPDVHQQQFHHPCNLTGASEVRPWSLLTETSPSPISSHKRILAGGLN